MNNTVDSVTLNALRRLEYRDPVEVLRNLRRVEVQLPSDVRKQVRHLRTNELKRVREAREAALFCCGMSCRIGEPVYFDPTEAADHDFVAMWTSGGIQHLVPVQIKELVPEELNAVVSVDDLVAGLMKYRSDHLTVAVHLNRAGTFEPSALRIPTLHIAALWFFWGAAPDQSKWCIFGDALGTPRASYFDYPM